MFVVLKRLAWFIVLFPVSLMVALLIVSMF